MIKKCPKQVFFIEKVNIHVKTVKMIVTARYMHISHECIAMMNGKIMVRLKTETEHLCKRGDRVQDSLWNKSSVWIDKIEFRTRLNQFECLRNMKTIYPR